MRVSALNTTIYNKQRVNNIYYSNGRIVSKNPSFGMIIMDPAPMPGFIIKILAELMKGKKNNVSGLNQVVGNSALKLGLIQNVLNPLKLAMDGYLHADKLIPNGIVFFGPPGVGKTFITKALMEQYQAMGGHIKELEFIGNDATDIANMRQIFTDAEQKFHESGNKKYTMVFLDSLENTAKRFDREHANEPRTGVLLDLVKNCKDRGVIFISNTLQPSINCPELLKNGRTDLRIPVNFVQKEDYADFLHHYIERGHVPTGMIDYSKITTHLSELPVPPSRPKEFENYVRNTAREMSNDDSKFDTGKIIKAINRRTNDDYNFYEDTIEYFNREKEFAKQLGGLNENAMR